MGFGPRELQVMFHPRLGGEEPEILERFGGVEMISHRDRCGLALAAELFDTFAHAVVVA